MTISSILHIDTGKSWGGGQIQTLYLIRGLQAAGLKSLLVCQPESPLYRRCNEENFSCKPVRVRGDLDLIAAWKIRSLLRRNSFDIIHAHSAHAHSIALLSRIFIKRKPALVVTRQVEFPPGDGRLSRKKYSAPNTGYIAVSRAVRDELIGAGISEANVRIIPIGTEIGRLESENEPRKVATVHKELGISFEDFVIGTVGSLIECKGQKFLLEAIPIIRQHIPRIRCIIVGDGPLMNSLRELAAKLDIEDQVVFTGFRSDANDLVRVMDLFVLPSLSEGFSYAALDAMALEKPVIVSAVGGLKDLVRDGENGLMVPASDPEKIAKAVVSLYDNKPYAGQLARGGAQDARANFTADNMVKKTIEYYEELVGKD